MVWFIRVIWIYLFVSSVMLLIGININPNMIVTTNILCFIISCFYSIGLLGAFIHWWNKDRVDLKKAVDEATSGSAKLETLFELSTSCMLIYTGHILTGLIVISFLLWLENIRYNNRKELNIKD